MQGMENCTFLPLIMAALNMDSYTFLNVKIPCMVDDLDGSMIGQLRAGMRNILFRVNYT